MTTVTLTSDREVDFMAVGSGMGGRCAAFVAQSAG